MAVPDRRGKSRGRRRGADLPRPRLVAGTRANGGKGAGRKIGLGSFLEFYDRDNIEYSGRGFPGSKESVER